MTRLRVVTVLGAVPLTLGLLMNGTAHAEVPPQYLPTPLGDTFGVPSPGFESSPNGTILRARQVTTKGIVSDPLKSWQLLVRTTDASDQPTAAISTLIVPVKPWQGAGPRPLVDYSMAEDSLGLQCAPSVALAQGKGQELDFAKDSLKKGYAFLTTDHEGATGAYSARLMAAHAVLDGVRAATHFPEGGISPDAPKVLAGYSGGGLAAAGAAEIAPSYAPELTFSGAVVGGVPADMMMVAKRLNGSVGSSYFLAAAEGIGRQYHDLFNMLNPLGRSFAEKVKDFCKQELTVAGVLPVKAELLSSPDVFDQPYVQQILAVNSLGTSNPKVPVYLFHGNMDEFMPLKGVQNLQKKWCAAGVPVSLTTSFGDHTVGEITSRADALTQVTAFLTGRGLSKPACG